MLFPLIVFSFSSIKTCYKICKFCLLIDAKIWSTTRRTCHGKFNHFQKYCRKFSKLIRTVSFIGMMITHNKIYNYVFFNSNKDKKHFLEEIHQEINAQLCDRVEENT